MINLKNGKLDKKFFKKLKQISSVENCIVENFLPEWIDFLQTITIDKNQEFFTKDEILELCKKFFKKIDCDAFFEFLLLEEYLKEKGGKYYPTLKSFLEYRILTNF